MFVYQRALNPSYGVFVMNRLSMENFVVELTHETEVEVMGDYVIYKATEGKTIFCTLHYVKWISSV